MVVTVALAAVMTALRALPLTAKPMDALRTAVSVWGATQVLEWPPAVLSPYRNMSHDHSRQLVVELLECLGLYRKVMIETLRTEPVTLLEDDDSEGAQRTANELHMGFIIRLRRRRLQAPRTSA